MNVREYFEQAFPAHFYPSHFDARGILEPMPLDSNCGDDCKVAIDRAKALDDLIREGHGSYYPSYETQTRAIAQVAADLCSLYICG